VSRKSDQADYDANARRAAEREQARKTAERAERERQAKKINVKSKRTDRD